MARSIDNLLLNPWFGAAMNGEFTTKSGVHTLARLAIATYKKGELTQKRNTLHGRMFNVVSYTPSWAAQVVSRVENNDDTELFTLDNIELTSTVGSVEEKLKYRFSDMDLYTFEQGHFVTLEPSDTAPQYFDVSSPFNLDVARNIFTTSVEGFFERVGA